MKLVGGANDAHALHAYIALGSNLGDSPGALRQAVLALQNLSREPIRSSSLWETTPVDCPEGAPPFINAVLRILPLVGESPESLLQKLQNLERRFGRLPKRVHNEARPLDLDLILFRAELRRSPDLTLPHPRALSRRFVLEPLSEIAPGLVFPGQTRTVIQLLSDLPADPGMRRVETAP